MSVLRDSHRGIVPAMLSTPIQLMQYVAFSTNSCQQFEGYQSAVDAKPQSIT